MFTNKFSSIRVLALGLVLTFALASCRVGKPPIETLTSTVVVPATATQTAPPTAVPDEPSPTVVPTKVPPDSFTPSPYPAPATLPPDGSGPYPAPGVATATPLQTPDSAYPDPQLASPTAIAGGPTAYPEPGGYIATPTQRTGAYPEPGSTPATPLVAPTPYPGPASPVPPVPTPSAPAQTQAGPTPGQTTPGTPAQATQTQTPTSTIIVRARLQASDPSSFRLATGQLQLVELFAFWSPVSRSMAPVIHGLEDHYRNQISFAYLDVDDPANDLFARLLGTRRLPVFFLMDGDGRVLNEWVGYVAPADFEAAFTQALLPANP